MRRVLLLFTFASAFSFALEMSHAPRVPHFFLERVLDPPGTSSLDLSCYQSEEPQKDPDCFVTWKKNGKKLLSHRFPIERGREIVSRLLASLPKKRIHTPILPTKGHPRLKADSVLSWKLGWGKEEAQGTISDNLFTKDPIAEKLVVAESLLSAEEPQ